jgi:ribonucleotide monophosphatase NagD (HAD superfamily)
MALLCGTTGLVKYIGKPFSDVYEIALRNKHWSRACMIGDALEMDVGGGLVEDIDTFWLSTRESTTLRF